MLKMTCAKHTHAQYVGLKCFLVGLINTETEVLKSYYYVQSMSFLRFEVRFRLSFGLGHIF